MRRSRRFQPSLDALSMRITPSGGSGAATTAAAVVAPSASTSGTVLGPDGFPVTLSPVTPPSSSTVLGPDGFPVTLGSPTDPLYDDLSGLIASGTPASINGAPTA